MNNTSDPGRAPGSMQTGMRAVTAPQLGWSSDAHPWMDAAECRKYVHRRSTGVGVDWFDLDHRTAAGICEGCPVRNACAERVLRLQTDPMTRPQAGVWAGQAYGKDAKEKAA